MEVMSHIKEYIMMKKKVEYLAIMNTCGVKNEELFSLEDEMKEFNLHNIKVKKYNDLCIVRPYDFIKKLE